jgi:hypothetical protein
MRNAPGLEPKSRTSRSFSDTESGLGVLSPSLATGCSKVCHFGRRSWRLPAVFPRLSTWATLSHLGIHLRDGPFMETPKPRHGCCAAQNECHSCRAHILRALARLVDLFQGCAAVQKSSDPHGSWALRSRALCASPASNAPTVTTTSRGRLRHLCCMAAIRHHIRVAGLERGRRRGFVRY